MKSVARYDVSHESALSLFANKCSIICCLFCVPGAVVGGTTVRHTSVIIYISTASL